MQVDDISGIIRREIVRQGTNPFRLAASAGLPENSIRTVLNGHEPKVGRVLDICRVLGLEFYIGPPRGSAEANGRKTAPVEADPSPAMAARLDAIQADLQALRAAVPGAATNFDDAAAFTVTDVDDSDAPPGSRPVAIVEASAAAGGGTLIEDAPIRGNAWFRRDWLDRHGLDATQCVIIDVKGESMEPVLMDGSSILVDRERTCRRADHIYVIRTGDGLVAKRLADGDDGWRLVSEHPQWPPVPWEEDMEIVGEVRWTARSLS